MQPVFRALAITWAAPASFAGLLVGGCALCTGGGVRRVAHTLEFHGGLLPWLLSWMPINAIAVTLGHVVVGRSPLDLDLVREHEWVHVRQYERWGPVFIPAYLGCSFGLWLWDQEWYWANPFEREAHEHDRLIALGEVPRRAPDRLE